MSGVYRDAVLLARKQFNRRGERDKRRKDVGGYIYAGGEVLVAREKNDTSCGGVLPSRAMEKESFPVFFALLNAARRNVTVRVLTNKYDEEEVGCDGRVTMKDFLSLAGVQVRYYQSTSFLHAKYIA